MKIAIPHWQGRISPVFDVARNVFLVENLNGEEQSRQDVIFDSTGMFSLRVRQLVQTGADVLICGAISRPLELAIRAEGIEVIPQTCGQVECVLEAFLRGQLDQTTFLMPGCRGRGLGNQRRRRGGRCWRQGRQDGGNHA